MIIVLYKSGDNNKNTFMIVEFVGNVKVKRKRKQGMQ